MGRPFEDRQVGHLVVVYRMNRWTDWCRLVGNRKSGETRSVGCSSSSKDQKRKWSTSWVKRSIG